jgi:hypothetical protein
VFSARQPPSLRVRIVDNPRVLTATTEEAAPPVIVIREGVALILGVIHACVPALIDAHPIVELRLPHLTVARVALLLV